MTTFNEQLATLAPVDHIQHIELKNTQGDSVALIENKPGSAGSVRVYHHLFQQFGAINAQAAQAGLAIYAEHTEDAKLHAGKHPNIDRLFDIINTNAVLSASVITRQP